MTTLTRDPGAPPAPARQRLTAIEELDYLLDRPWEPNLVLWELHSHGHLDRDLLTGALTAALGSDSGARRRLAATPRWGRRLYWRQSPVPGPYAPAADGASLLTVAEWRTPAELEALRQRLFAWPIALEQAVVRVVLAIGPEYDALILQVHHTAFDGISSLRLLTGITRAYRDQAGPAPRLHSVPKVPLPPAPLAPASTPARHDPPSPAGRAAPRVAPKLVTWAHRRTWPGTVTRIAPQAGQPDRPGYGFVLVEDTVARREANGPGPRPTVNDLLVAALSLTIDRWNTAHGRASGQISVTIPVNGRTAGPHWEGPGNLSRLIRVVTSPAQRANPDILLTSVAAQTRTAREQGRVGGSDALSRLLATAWAPVPVKRRAARLVRDLAAPVITDTSMVSNLGVLADPPTFDGRGTDQVWLASPCPMPRGLSVGALTIAGRLYLSVRYRLALMDQAAAEDFMACFRAAIAELARPGPAVAAEAP